MAEPSNSRCSLECAFSLTPAELDDFFPHPLRDDLFALIAPSCLLREKYDFAASLGEAAPKVLLAGLSTPPLPETLPPSLRYVCYLAGSVKCLVTRRHLEKGLLVTNWGDFISHSFAETALWHILSGLRRGTQWTLPMHCNRAWKSPHVEAASLLGRRVGLHGFGYVARELVRLLQPFGCQISVFAPQIDPAMASTHGVAVATSLEALFEKHDIVVELASLTPATKASITEDLLRRLRPGSVFVNVDRGSVVDDVALVRIAQERMVFFGLNVFATKLLPMDSPLRGLPNVSLSPHPARPTTDHWVDAGAFALANLRAFAAGRPLQALVTPALYDASS